MATFDPFPEGTPAAEILKEILGHGQPSLGPAVSRPGGWRSRIDGLTDAELLGAGAVSDARAAAAVRAGLLLVGDDFEASHSLSQSIETPEGSYWHGILHRREPDYGNAKYWFRRVGDHPVFRDLEREAVLRGGAALDLLSGRRWDPFRVVDLIERCETGGPGPAAPELRHALLDFQELEMLLLLAQGYRQSAAR